MKRKYWILLIVVLIFTAAAAAEYKERWMYDFAGKRISAKYDTPFHIRSCTLNTQHFTLHGTAEAEGMICTYTVPVKGEVSDDWQIRKDCTKRKEEYASCFPEECTIAVKEADEEYGRKSEYVFVLYEGSPEDLYSSIEAFLETARDGELVIVRMNEEEKKAFLEKERTEYRTVKDCFAEIQTAGIFRIPY